MIAPSKINMTVTLNGKRSDSKQKPYRSGASAVSFIPAGKESVGLYAFIEEWNRGVLPTNSNVIALFDSIDHAVAQLNVKTLSEAGKEFINQIYLLISLLKRLVLEKNNDNLLQKLSNHIRLAVNNLKHYPDTGRANLTDNVTIFGREDAMAEEEKMRLKRALAQLVDEADHLAILGQLMLTSPDFRNLIDDILILFKEILFLGLEPNATSSVHQYSLDQLNSHTSYKKPLVEYYPGQNGVQTLNDGTKSTVSKKAAIIQKGKLIFTRLHQQHHFVSAISCFFKIIQKKETITDSIQSSAIVQQAAYDANIEAAKEDLFTLAQRFSSGKSPRHAIAAINEMWNRSHDDPAYYELEDFFEDWTAFIKKSASNEKYVKDPEFDRRASILIDRTSESTKRKYQKMFNNVIAQCTEFVQGWENDPLTNELGKSIKHFTTIGEKLATSSDLLHDLRQSIIPAMLKAVYLLPLPHIEITDRPSGTKISLDGIAIPASLFHPLKVDLGSRSSLNLPREGETLNHTTSWQNIIYCSLSGMKGDIPAVRFAFERTSWPRLKDQGLVSIRLGGNVSGLSIGTEVETESKEIPLNSSGTDPKNIKQYTLTPRKITANCPKLGLYITRVRHAALFSIIRPYLESRLRKKLERTICERIIAMIDVFNNLIIVLSRGLEGSG